MLQRFCLNGAWLLGHADGERGRPDYALADTLDESRYFEARVPGGVHLDLLRAGLIEEPTLGLNALRARWVEECIWTYRREFDAPPAALAAEAWLVFDGLDLDARIYLNGTLLGEHHNAFLPCRLAATGRLRPGRNILVVILDAGLIAAGDKPSASLGNQNHYAFSRALHKSHWLRKPAFQFGWDWTTRLGNVGIFAPVALEFTAAPVRLGALVPLVAVADDLASARVTVRLRAENLGPAARLVALVARVPELGWSARVEHTLPPGEHPLELTGEVRDFALWWPRGHGEPRCYTLEAALEDEDGQLHPAPPARIGFRHTRLDESPRPAGGRHCVLRVNHRPIFLQGANWVPPDLLLGRIDDRAVTDLLRLALEANFNFIRVWGGGRYESDAFYDFCDAHGLLVWQDFAYACAKYPLTDETLFLSAKAEARHQIRRLAAHPSLVVWCGNNEMECGNWHWGYDRGTIFPDYAFFHHVLPRLLGEEDPTRIYRPSSPFSPDQQSPARDDMGDQHNWKVSLEHSDYRAWREMDCRMMTEAGYLGPASLPTLRDCLPPESAPAAVRRFAWRQHDNSVDSWHADSLPDRGFLEHLGRRPADLAPADFVYLGGLLHGEALATFAGNFRRRRFDSSSACFWMFNDAWPTVRSWTIVDYNRRRTPAFWAVRRAFAPLALVLHPAPDGIQVFGLNDHATPFVGHLEAGLLATRATNAPATPAAACTIPARGVALLATLPPLTEAEGRSRLPYAVLRDERGQVVARERLVLPRLCELDLEPAPRPLVEVANGVATFTCEHFVLGVCLDLDGDRALADNFFDLLPGQPHAIAWPWPEPPRISHFANAWLPASQRG